MARPAASKLKLDGVPELPPTKRCRLKPTGTDLKKEKTCDKLLANDEESQREELRL